MKSTNSPPNETTGITVILNCEIGCQGKQTEEYLLGISGDKIYKGTAVHGHFQCLWGGLIFSQQPARKTTPAEIKYIYRNIFGGM